MSSIDNIVDLLDDVIVPFSQSGKGKKDKKMGLAFQFLVWTLTKSNN